MAENISKPAQISPVAMSAKRPPEVVMRLERMGASFPTRLSFMRGVIRRLRNENWRIGKARFDLNADGYGIAVYSAVGPEHTYSLVAFSTELAPEDRTDRVIAEAWDATFVLLDGVPSDNDIERLRRNAPKQEAGRFSPRELVLSRANRSVRLFEHVVSSLASGNQPDLDFLSSIGYLMRTTAVYGNGKFGIADRSKIAGRPEFFAPFQAELLTVYLIRCFTHDLVEHIATARSPGTACALAPHVKRHLGIGNATGLGMAPFLHTHPILLHNWVDARETAIARVRALDRASESEIAHFRRVLSRARQNINEWQVGDHRQMARIITLRREIDDLVTFLSGSDLLTGTDPWDRLYCYTEQNYSLEGQELIAALILEPYGGLVDDLFEMLSAANEPQIHSSMTVGELQKVIRDHYDWATKIAFADQSNSKYFWYVSEEKSEPRLGHRASEDGASNELPLHVARDVQALASDLEQACKDMTVAEFLIAAPEQRHIVRRVQSLAHHPYAEIYDNLIGSGLLPIDMLRFKLAFFGATKFDPKSDRWTRINMYQGAPLITELSGAGADDWAFPVMPSEPGAR